MMKERRIMLEEARVKLFIGENADDGTAVVDDDISDDNGDVERDKEFFLVDVKWDRRRLLMSINAVLVVKVAVVLLELCLSLVVGMMFSNLKIGRFLGLGRRFIRPLRPHSSILVLLEHSCLPRRIKHFCPVLAIAIRPVLFCYNDCYYYIVLL